MIYHLRYVMNLLDQNNNFIYHFKERFIDIIYLFVIFHLIVYRHYVTERQHTVLFNMTCTCMLKMANKAVYCYHQEAGDESFQVFHDEDPDEAGQCHFFHPIALVEGGLSLLSLSSGVRLAMVTVIFSFFSLFSYSCSLSRTTVSNSYHLLLFSVLLPLFLDLS